jgi:hypothetical protein
MSKDQIFQLATRIGFADPNLAAAIAMAESSGDAGNSHIVSQAQADAWNALHPLNRHGPERSFGLWQINTIAHPNYDEHLLLDPEYNARAALTLSNGGTDWHQWGAFTDGRYKRYL